MPRQISEDELSAIENCLELFPNGASLQEIGDALEWPMIRRNLQRRLAFLGREGRLLIEGGSRATRYRLPLSKSVPPQDTIPLSSAAAALQLEVRQPLQTRTPVGYNRDFLDHYRPNVTHYLPEPIQQQLLQLGKTDGERPAGTYAREILNRLLIDLSWNSSRLEGNTYSLLETERLLRFSEIVKGKDLKEARMILNHKDAIEFLVDSADGIGVNRHTILNLHALLSNDLMGDLEACGRLRSIPVAISKTVYYPPSIPWLIAESFQQVLDTANAIKNPFEQAFFLLVHLPYLQPFEDVNKRTSRLAANIPLILQNLCPLSFVDVPEQTYVSGLLGVYELNRIELLRDVFIWAYERSCFRYSATRKELGDPDPFRMRYRTPITELVTTVVRKSMDKPTALAAIRQYAQEFLPPEEQARFIEVVEKDIKSLHEGNIARHRIRPKEYENWQKVWS